MPKHETVWGCLYMLSYKPAHVQYPDSMQFMSAALIPDDTQSV